MDALGRLPVVVVAHDDLIDPWRFVELLVRHHVTRIIFSPSYLRVLLDAVPGLGRRVPDLWLWNISGEVIPAELARRFFAAVSHGVLFNAYGSTEAPNATYAALTEALADSDFVIAGRPVDNVAVRVANQQGQSVAIGEPGEIWIGGVATALGYLNDAERTAERFVIDPTAPGGRWYRTGDRGSWLPDGTLRSLGRADRQIKVRGMRVELDEIEARLGEHPDVLEAAVVASEGASGPRLSAFVRARPGTEPRDVRAFLAERLPTHVVPQQIQIVPDFPRTSSGKMDRRTLASLPQNPSRLASSRPLDDRERALATVWATLLDRDRASIGADDDFFDIGGHSLLAIELVVRVEEQFGVHLPMQQLFTTPTLAGLANAIAASSIDGFAQASGAVQLTEGEPHRTPVFCVAGLGSTILGWRRIAARLDERIPVFGVESVGFGSGERPLRRVADLAEHHLELLAATSGDRPVVLCGHSFGGLVVYEMARILEAHGTPAAGLVLLDTPSSRRAGRPRLTAKRLPRLLHRLARHQGASAQRSVGLAARERGLISAKSGEDRVRWVVDAQRAATDAWTAKPYGGSLVLLAFPHLGSTATPPSGGTRSSRPSR